MDSLEEEKIIYKINQNETKLKIVAINGGELTLVL